MSSVHTFHAKRIQTANNLGWCEGQVLPDELSW